MKLVYIVQEDSNKFIKGVFHNVQNALQCAFDQFSECTSKELSFSIIECPVNKSIDDGIITHIVKSYHTSLSEVLDVNSVYEFGGIKKWVNDQRRAAKK